MQNVVLKLSGEAIGDKGNSLSGYDDARIDSIVLQIDSLVESGVKFSCIVGGGNYWRGRSARPDMDKVKADHMGMLATIMNALYLSEAFKRRGREAKVMTPLPFGGFTTVYQKDEAQRLLNSGVVLIHAAGLGHPFFSTDTITALRAAELEADCILFAKSGVDGVYTTDPNKDEDAQKYRELSYKTAIERNLGIVDIAALHLAKGAGIPSFVFDLRSEDSIFKACRQPELLAGTYIKTDTEDSFY